MNNKEMLLTIAAFALTLILVYAIRRLSVDYAWTIAIVAGTVTDIVVLLFGSLAFDVSPKILAVLVGKPGFRRTRAAPSACGLQSGLFPDRICTV